MNQVYGETLFNFLYGNVKGYDVSNTARLRHGDQKILEELLYGEVPFLVWNDIVKKADPKKDGVFFDLGSGTGRMVIASHMLFGFKKSIGVELLAGLHDASCAVKERFDRYVKPAIAAELTGREMEFRNEDIFAVNLSEADFIFMNHPFKDRALFVQLEAKLIRELKSGTKIVTTIRGLQDPRFSLKGTKKYTFSWGDSTAYFYEK